MERAKANRFRYSDEPACLGAGRADVISAAKKGGAGAGKRQRSQTDHAKAKRAEHRRNRRLKTKEKQAVWIYQQVAVYSC